MVDEGRKYVVLGAIGRGGFGKVYQAEMRGEQGFSKLVALKVLNSPEQDAPDIARRLRDEARLLAQVHHRAVAKVDLLVRLDGRWTIVMEWIDGTDLRRLLDQGPIPEGPSLEIAAEVLQALAAAWEQLGRDGQPLQLLHRDVKPSNILLTPDGTVKLLDFGTATANVPDREAETTSVGYGTLDYMAPERLDFKDSPGSDVYSVGSLLYECLCGQRLGRTSANPATHEELIRKAIDRLEFEGYSSDLVRLIGSMLSYSPEARPSARMAASRLRDLRRVAAGSWLSDWSSDAVPPLRVTPQNDGDPWIGATLLETGALHRETYSTPIPKPRTVPPPVKTESAPWAAWVAFGLAVAAGALVIVVLGTSFFAYWLRPAPAEPPEALVVVDPPIPHPLIEEPPEDPPLIEVGPLDPPPVKDPKSPDSKPKKFKVSVVGDVNRVELVSGSKRYSPGPVPPGEYTIYATFGGGAEVVAGRVDVRGELTLRCNAGFDRCDPVVP